MSKEYQSPYKSIRVPKPAIPVERSGEVGHLAAKVERYRRDSRDYKNFFEQLWLGDKDQPDRQESLGILLDVLRKGSLPNCLEIIGEEKREKIEEAVTTATKIEKQGAILALRNEIRKKFKEGERQIRSEYQDYIKQRRKNANDLLFYETLEQFINKARVEIQEIKKSSIKEGRKYLTEIEAGKQDNYESIIGVARQRQEELEKQNQELALTLRMRELLEYERQAGDHFIITPSVREYKERVKQAWRDGKMVLLTGPTGGGKTEILVEAAKEMDKGFPELIAGTEQTGLAEIFGSVGLKEGEKGGTETKYEPGPFTKALQKGTKLVFDEINLVSNKINMVLKAIANRRPGEPADIPRNGKVIVADGYAIGATMNVKSEKHKDRSILDPAIARIFREQMKINYSPKEEMYDACFATLIDPAEGTAHISKEDAEGVLKNFVEAVAETQRAYEGESEFIEPGKAAQKKKSSLEVAVIDIGAALTMLKPVDFSKPGAKINLGIELARFASREIFPPKDRALLGKIFAKWKLLDGVPWKELQETGLLENDLTSLGWKKKEEPAASTEKWQEMTALQVASLDPFNIRKKKKEQADAEEFGLSEEEEGDAEGKGTEAEFSFSEIEARRLGLEKLELPAYPKADALISEVINKTIDIAAPNGRQAFVEAWQRDCPGLPPPCVPDADGDWTKGNYWYLTQLSNNRIISSLTDNTKTVRPNFSQAEFLLVDAWPEEDWDEPEQPGASEKKLQKIISPLLQELLCPQQIGVVGITRETIDEALWIGDPAERIPAEKHKEILKKLGCNPEEFELRCIRQDEYVRGSISKGWGKKDLWTNFDHFFLGGDGDRGGLDGGYRSHGGPSHVGCIWRGDASASLSVRLVLSRKQ